MYTHLEYKSGAPGIISVTGGPGFGKSRLAIHMGYKLRSEGIDVIYIDMNEVLNMHTLANKVLQFSQKSLSTRGNVTMQHLYEWSSNLKHKTLLILDNCDQQFHTNKDNLQGVVTKLSNFVYLKVLTTSRQQVAYIEKYKPLVINELPMQHACKLLFDLTDNSLTNIQCQGIVNVTGSVPLALSVIGALLNMPTNPSPDWILSQLRKNLLETLSPEELKTEDRVNASIYLSYHYLERDVRKVGQYLSYFPGSFEENAANEIIRNVVSDKNKVHKPLQVLVRRSLLHCNHATNRYVYHTLIREFFKGRSTHKEANRFDMLYMNYYVSVLERITDGDSIRAAYEFFINKHDFIHFFNLLSNTSNKNFNKIFIKTVDTVSNFITEHNILDYGFSKLEVKKMIESFLSCLKQIHSHLIEQQFVKVYSSMVLHLIRVEKLLSQDARTMIKSIKVYWWIFEQHGQHIDDQEYIQFYFTLSEYYEELKEHKKAKQCHTRMLQREKALGKCHKECSNLELAKAFAFTKDYKRSIYYCDEEVKRLTLVSPSNIKEVMETIDKYLQVYFIYSQNDASLDLSIDAVIAKLADIIIDTLLINHHPSFIFKHNYTSNFIQIIHLFESTGRKRKAKQLVEYFKRGLKTLHLSCAVISDLSYIVSDLVRDYQDVTTYEIAIFIGENLLYRLYHFEYGEPLKSFLPLGSGECNFPWEVSSLLQNIAYSYFHLGNYTESSSYYAKVAANYMKGSCILLVFFPYVYSFLPGAYHNFVECLYSYSSSCSYSHQTTKSHDHYTHLEGIKDITVKVNDVGSVRVHPINQESAPSISPPSWMSYHIDILIESFLSLNIIRYSLAVLISFLTFFAVLCWPCIIGIITHCCHTCLYNTTCLIYQIVIVLFLINSNLPYYWLHNVVSVIIMFLVVVATFFTGIFLISCTTHRVLIYVISHFRR